jgi:DNA-binding beta-propeller fold protein YncE
VFVWLSLIVGLGFACNVLAATPTPLAGLQFETQITIPTWTTSGPTQASTDTWSFDPSTNTLYFADRVNKGVSVIDTNTNTYLGTIAVPGCDGTGSCPSGVLVAPDLHKLVVTDRLIGAGATLKDLNHIFIYDLRILSAPPVTLTVDPAVCTACSGTAFDTDELEYDPLNQRAYVANTSAPFFLTVVDLNTNTIVDQIPLPSNPEQPRFNPVDGMIYQSIPDDADPNTGQNSAVLRIDPTKTGAAAIVATFRLGPSCLTRGIDIDPLTNQAIVGCAGDGPQVLMDLSGNMSLLDTFPGVTGTDTEYFNPNLRRWYTASSNNTNSGVQCPGNAANPQVFPVVGVFAAPRKLGEKATLVGAECSGTNGHDIGVDPVHNQVYVGVRQLADPNSLSSGSPGVLVWHDPAPLAQPRLVEESVARLNSLAGGQSNGRVLIFDSHVVRATITNVTSDKPALLNVTTTIGNEVVDCDSSGTSIICGGVLKGRALIQGVVILASGGTPVAKGTIVPQLGKVDLND